MFPGQGSQTVGMLGELAVPFEEVLGGFDDFDAAIRALGGEPVGPEDLPSPRVRRRGPSRPVRRAAEPPRPPSPPSARRVSAASRLLRSLGLAPDLVAGHSYGELVALHAAGALDVRGLAELSMTRGACSATPRGENPGAMAALATGAETTASLIGVSRTSSAVNINGPRQTVVAGSEASVQAVSNARGPRRSRPTASRRLRLPHAADGRRTRAAGPAGRRPTDRRADAARSSRTSTPRRTRADPSAIADRLGDHVV